MAARKVLIVEDDMLTALGMADVLTFAGFEVVGTARRVAEAVALGARTRPDVAIFDVQLAGRRDGIEGADLLHRMLGVRVIFLTAQANQETMARSEVADPVAYLPKPCAPRELLHAVQAAVKSASAPAIA